MTKTYLRRIISINISVVLLLVLVGYAPWHQIWNILQDFDLGTILLLISLSLLYYGLKSWRFWYLLRAIKLRLALEPVVVSYMSAQPASLIPAGEIFRSHALERFTGTPVKRSLPQFIMQGILEGSGLATIMIVCSLALHALRVPAIILTILVTGAMYGLAKDYLVWPLKTANKLPFVHLKEKSIDRFSARHRDVLNRRRLPVLYGSSLLIELVGVAIAYVSVVGLGGHVNIYQAGLMYAVPIIVGFISLLPGGIGLSEQSAIGILLLSNNTTAVAVAATLIMRVTIVGLGVIYGIIAGIVGNKRYGSASQTR